MKLFAIYIGGEAAGANIEVHDIRFVVAPSVVDTYDELRRQWWGIASSLHIDCWAEIDHADGHEISLRPEPFGGAERLYYVNLGGYDPAHFLEMHKNMFVVADSAQAAKSRALKTVRHWDAKHKDDIYEAEQAFALTGAASALGLHIHLRPTAIVRPFTFTCDYTPIARR